MKRKIWIFFGGMSSVAALVATELPSVQTPEPYESTVTEYSDSASERPDSITEESDSIFAEIPDPAVILTDEAGALYKDVKFMQYEGELERTLYPKIYEAVAKACEALEASQESSDQALKSRNLNIIVDLNPALMDGAAYYSNEGNNTEFMRYARLIVDSRNLSGIDKEQFKTDPGIYAVLVYNAAYDASSRGENDKAKEYFLMYLATNDQRMRENVYAYLGQLYIKEGAFKEAVEWLVPASKEFPANANLLMLAMQACLEGGYPEELQPLLTRALLTDPNNEKLLNIQARMYEKEGDFKQALDIYQQIAENHPNSLENTRRVATCQYNLGADYYNRSIMESDEKAASRLRRQSKAYFSSAYRTLEQVLATVPTDMPMLRALTQTYAMLGDKEKFDNANRRVAALGGKQLAFTDMPVMMGGGGVAGNTDRQDSHALVKVPDYDTFARPYIEERLGSWAKRGEFEKFEDYKTRIAGGGGLETYNKLNEEAAAAYLDMYGRRLLLTDLKRSDYDIDNETFMIETPYGPTVVKVPLKNKEAEGFKASWETMQIRAPKFMIKDNNVAIAEITYIVNGKRYTYTADQAETYHVPNVHVDVNGILAAAQASEGKHSSTGNAQGAVAGIWTESDVDKDIPVTARKAEQIQALIIANENYNKASSVFGALHDGATMKEYLAKTIGVPEHQIISVNNATGNQVRDALEQLRRRVKGIGSNAEVIFYYAGHGLPDDATKDAYMMPVDANPLTINTLIPMKEIYASLRDMDAQAVSVFLDACFSGEGRDGSTINEARGVALKAKEVQPQGNMFVLSAASAQETAMPYKEKHHGLFTYYLLKVLQESKGKATLKEISDYVIKNVRKTSNSDPAISKEQNPTVATSGEMTTLYTKRSLRRK